MLDLTPAPHRKLMCKKNLKKKKKKKGENPVCLLSKVNSNLNIKFKPSAAYIIIKMKYLMALYSGHLLTITYNVSEVAGAGEFSEFLKNISFFKKEG